MEKVKDALFTNSRNNKKDKKTKDITCHYCKEKKRKINLLEIVPKKEIRRES